MSPFHKDLGVGVGLRPAHFSRFIEQKPSTVSWVEVISENYMSWKNQPPGAALQRLRKVRSELPVVLHGVSLSIGSVDEVNLDYLKRLKELMDHIQPAWISDHLCWTGVKGQNLHDLLPLPYTQETLLLVSQKIDQVQNYLGRKILIENPSSYLAFQQSEMSEDSFLNELVKKADCGLLLDVNNVYVSAVNHGFDAQKYLMNIPIDRVGQIHLAGHSDMDGYLIDTHDMPICEEVWRLYQFAIQRFGAISTMVERDDNIPEWEELEKEIVKIGDLRDEEFKKTR